jgi:hypothetical protein
MNQQIPLRCLAALPLILGLSAPVGAQTAPPPAAATSAEAPPPTRTSGSFEGFDFSAVVETMESSVDPLQREMDLSFKVFTQSIQQAERLLDEGATNDAVQMASAAVEGVLAVRDQVLAPMWEGQLALTEQTGKVRLRLAKAVASANAPGPVAADPQTEVTLDNIAGRIGREQDPIRKQRLVAHYRTVRNLARIKAMAQQLSPDQRKLWLNVLKVLDEAALTHQRVLMGSEILFAQLEATSLNLRDYLSLMNTVEGVSALLGVVRGAGDDMGGMSGFVDSMNQLQNRLGSFNESVQQALQGRMIDLSEQIDAIDPADGSFGDVGGSPVMSSEIDSELSERIRRVAQPRIP